MCNDLKMLFNMTAVSARSHLAGGQLRTRSLPASTASALRTISTYAD
jgi:hypothetical protein